MYMMLSGKQKFVDQKSWDGCLPDFPLSQLRFFIFFGEGVSSRVLLGNINRGKFEPNHGAVPFILSSQLSALTFTKL